MTFGTGMLSASRASAPSASDSGKNVRFCGPEPPITGTIGRIPPPPDTGMVGPLNWPAFDGRYCEVYQFPSWSTHSNFGPSTGGGAPVPLFIT